MPDTLQDEFMIRSLIDNWAIWRDAGEWDRLRTTFHPDGMMQTTWFYGPGADFVKGSQAAFERGVEVLHTLHGTSIDLKGDRAIAQTKMAIHQRSDVNGVLCDCVCQGRFYDLLEKRGGMWGIVLRHPIYEMDRLDPVNSSASLNLNREELASFPAGYPAPCLPAVQNGLEGGA